jgi:predicted membrane-bound mannosyltransferase
MPAIEELFSFGVFFVIFYLATQLYASYLTNKAISKKPGMLPLVLNAMVARGFIQEWAYSVRTGYRFYLYALAGCAFL